VRGMPTPLQVYQKQAMEKGVLTEQDVDVAARRMREHLDRSLSEAREESDADAELKGLWKGMFRGENAQAAVYATRVPEEKLYALSAALSRVPQGLTINPKVGRILKYRSQVAQGEKDLNWAMAEALAFASLVEEGHPVRLSGQDSGRATFSFRHAVLHDQKTGEGWVSLAHVAPGQAPFEVFDSPLSEAAVLGFEYGYSLAVPDALVLWEAQFGDFANSAQVIIDQFISSSEDKWDRCSGMVLMLPHGFEGQGPEHSSARLERFLNLSGEDNWRVMNLTQPAQLFHALRGQLKSNFRKPMVIMTPKSLLRHPLVTSPMQELANGHFHRLIDDVEVEASQVERIVLCSGKVYFDLLKLRQERKETRVALVRIEQLYPFPDDRVEELFERYSGATEVVWCQEEPENMGSWHFVLPLLYGLTTLRLRYAGRTASAAPATGSKYVHEREQNALVAQALDFPQ